MNLLITGAWQQAAEYIAEIEKNHKVAFLQFEKDELPCAEEWVEGVIGNGFFLSHPIEKFSNLRYIQLTSAGYDRVPMEYICKKQIKINNARGVYSVPMAEYAVAGVLQLYKEMSGFHESQKAHLWNKQRDLRELAGKRVAIVGCGSVGTECAKRFKAFDACVIGVDFFTCGDVHYDMMKETGELDSVLGDSDVVIITVPLTDETEGLFGAERLGKMKDGAVLVNIARGAVVETAPLITELQTGRIGAVLDVFETEPLEEDSPLWDMKNVVITPHNSFVGEGNGKRMSDVIMKNLEEYGGYGGLV